MRVLSGAQINGLAAGAIPECLAAEPLSLGQLVKNEVLGMRDITHFYLAWRDDQTGKAPRWWVDQLHRPDLIAEVESHVAASYH